MQLDPAWRSDTWTSNALLRNDITLEQAKIWWRLNAAARWLLHHLILAAVVAAYVATTYWANDGVWPWQ